MSLLFLSFHLWCTALCDKHFIFTSWWCVQDHVSVMFTFSAAVILLNLCVGTCCASADPTAAEKCRDTSLWESSAMLFEGFWEVFSLLCIFCWNNFTNPTIPLKPQWDTFDVMDWLPYWKIVTTETLTQFGLLTHLPVQRLGPSLARHLTDPSCRKAKPTKQ